MKVETFEQEIFDQEIFYESNLRHKFIIFWFLSTIAGPTTNYWSLHLFVWRIARSVASYISYVYKV